MEATKKPVCITIGLLQRLRGSTSGDPQVEIDALAEVERFLREAGLTERDARRESNRISDLVEKYGPGGLPVRYAFKGLLERASQAAKAEAEAAQENYSMEDVW